MKSEKEEMTKIKEKKQRQSTYGVWTIVDGVSPEARAIAEKLAKERKVTIGQLLNDAILELKDQNGRIKGNDIEGPSNATITLMYHMIKELILPKISSMSVDIQLMRIEALNKPRWKFWV